MKPKENILDKWYKHWEWQTSFLNIFHHNRLRFDREDIKNIYSFLSDFFGIEYFEPMTLGKMTIDNLNPIISALIHKIPSSNFRLFEIISAIEFSKRSASYHYQNLTNNKTNLESFFPLLFESEIKTLLLHNGFSIYKESKKNIAKFDGVMTYQSQDFIIECKKLYSANFLYLRKFWNVLFGMLNEINKQRYGYPIYGYFDICVKNKKGSSHNQKMNFNAFSNDLLKYGRGNHKYRTGNDVLYLFPYHQMEYNILKIENKHTVLFCLRPVEDLSIVGPEKKYRYHSEIMFKASIDLQDVNNKMKRNIRQAIKQHEDVDHLPLIVFIDNEKYLSSVLPLFNSKEDIDLSWIKNKIKKTPRDLIICMYLRDYGKYYPRKKMLVFGPDRLKHLCDKISRMNMHHCYTKNSTRSFVNFQR